MPKLTDYSDMLLEKKGSRLPYAHGSVVYRKAVGLTGSQLKPSLRLCIKNKVIFIPLYWDRLCESGLGLIASWDLKQRYKQLGKVH